MRDASQRNSGLIASVVIGSLASLALVFVLAGTARSQDLYGSIRGTVTDPTGAAVPGVELTATNMATNVSQHATSKPDGSYAFLQLAVGNYLVKAEKTGFKLFTAAGIHLDVNTVFTENVQLTVGATSQAITVEANTVQVETTTTQLGTVV